jgi:hypothetical protein
VRALASEGRVFRGRRSRLFFRKLNYEDELGSRAGESEQVAHGRTSFRLPLCRSRWSEPQSLERSPFRSTHILRS